MESDLHDKLAVVTGGSNGIGQGYRAAPEAEGAVVRIFDLESDPPVDVSDRAFIDAAFASTGTPDIVVANAGMVRQADLDLFVGGLAAHSGGQPDGYLPTVRPPHG